MDDGTYKGKAVHTTLGYSNQKNTPGVEITFRLTDSWISFATTLWLSEGAAERTRDTLQSMGFTGDDISVLHECNEETCSRLLPNEMDLVIETEFFTGNDGVERSSQKIKYVNAPSRSMLKTVAAGDAKAFAMRFRALFAAGGATAERKPKTKHQSEPAVSEDESWMGNDPF